MWSNISKTHYFASSYCLGRAPSTFKNNIRQSEKYYKETAKIEIDFQRLYDISHINDSEREINESPKPLMIFGILNFDQY